MNRDEKSVILFFVRAPERGRVKTRLAEELGEGTALDLYRCFVKDTMTTLASTGYMITICFTPINRFQSVKAWLGNHRTYQVQEGNDLGDKMANAFERVFENGIKKAVLVGSDIPDLPPAFIQKAFDALTGHDTVLGPASDGGYYLIGFRSESFMRQVFENIPWGTETVFVVSQKRITNAGNRLYVLPVWHDTDDAKDLAALFKRQEQAGQPASATWRYIDDMNVINRFRVL